MFVCGSLSSKSFASFFCVRCSALGLTEGGRAWKLFFKIFCFFFFHLRYSALGLTEGCRAWKLFFKIFCFFYFRYRALALTEGGREWKAFLENLLLLFVMLDAGRWV